MGQQDRPVTVKRWIAVDRRNHFFQHAFREGDPLSFNGNLSENKKIQSHHGIRARDNVIIKFHLTVNQCRILIGSKEEESGGRIKIMGNGVIDQIFSPDKPIAIKSDLIQIEEGMDEGGVVVEESGLFNDTGYRMSDTGCWMLDTGCSMFDVRC